MRRAKLIAVGCFICVTGCGGGSSGPPPNPVPVITALSPASTAREGPPFTLTVTGTGFVTGATIMWGGTALTTTWVSSSTLTAQVPTSDILVAGSYSVTVSNQPPGGGTSAAATFNIPCVLATPTAASTQSRVRVGAYYFDGWTSVLSGSPLDGLRNGPYQDREPLSGWQDNNSCAVEQQLAWSHQEPVYLDIYRHLAPSDN